MGIPDLILILAVSFATPIDSYKQLILWVSLYRYLMYKHMTSLPIEYELERLFYVSYGVSGTPNTAEYLCPIP